MHTLFLFVIIWAETLQQSLKLLLDSRLGLSTNETVNDLTILEEQDCRNVTNAELHHDIIVLLNVALTNNNLAVVLLCQLLDIRSNSTTRSTPCCPEIHY